MKTKQQYIQLSQGKTTIIDNEDSEYLNQFKWYFNDGYAVRNVYLGGGRKNKKIKRMIMHRVILERHNLLKVGYQVDHINRNKLDNQKNNLRLATIQQNKSNVTTRSDNVSGFKGVSWYSPTKKWCARIGFRQKITHIGYFLNLEDAVCAYNKIAKEKFGEFAYINSL